MCTGRVQLASTPMEADWGQAGVGRGRTWKVGWLAPPPIGVKRADWGQARQDTGAAGGWEGLIRAPIRLSGYCSACHSGQLFWSFCLSGCLAFIYIWILLSVDKKRKTCHLLNKYYTKTFDKIQKPFLFSVK